jgi:hypothetical protein
MRNGIAGILCLASLVSVAQVEQPQVQQPQVQQPQQTYSHEAARDGGVREVVEGILIPPVPHAPFTATLATESVKYAADGAAMTFNNERRIARDAQGRVYQERWYLVPKGGKIQSTMNWIQIADPNRLTLYNCSIEVRICDLLVYDPANSLSGLSPHRGTSGPLPQGGGSVVWEDLGKRNIAGIETAGTRETTTTDPGTMGNDQPLTYVSEYWHSEQLGINLLSFRTSPFFGKQTFTITEITAADPDPQLYTVPAGFKVNDQRKTPRISH